MPSPPSSSPFPLARARKLGSVLRDQAVPGSSREQLGEQIVRGVGLTAVLDECLSSPDAQQGDAESGMAAHHSEVIIFFVVGTQPVAL